MPSVRSRTGNYSLCLGLKLLNHGFSIEDKLSLIVMISWSLWTNRNKILWQNIKFQACSICDSSKPKGLLTNDQLVKNSRMSGDPDTTLCIPFIGIHKFNN